MRNLCLFVFLIIFSSHISSCATYGDHSMYRGVPNVPHHRIVPLGVDPNIIFSMSNNEYDHYMTKLERYQRYTGDAIRLDERAANAAKQWVNDSNTLNQRLYGFDRVVPNATRTFSNELSRSLNNTIRSIFD